MKVRDMILVALFAALTAIGAFIQIPFYPVPFTLQYLFCAFSGILLGARLGLASQLLYVGIGLAGIPIFTHGGGPGYIFQPTFGYLIGFIAASYIIGKLFERLQTLSFIKVLLCLIPGLAVIYLIGVPYLYVVRNFYLGSTFSVWNALKFGCLLFLTSDVMWTIIIAFTAAKVVPILKKAHLIPSRA